MLIAVGTEVQLIHTGDVGVVTALQTDGLLRVRLREVDLEIPVSAEDVRRLRDVDSSVKARIVPSRQPKPAPAPPREAPTRQYTILKPQGVQVGFDPQLRPDGIPEGYRVYLINDLPQGIIFTLRLYIKKQLYWTANGRLDAQHYTEVNGLTYDQLNDQPELDVQLWPVQETGTGSRLHKRIRIKPKPFFNNLRTAPLLDRPVHLYKLFAQLIAPATPVKGEDIRSYTNRRAEAPPQYNLYRPAHEVEELAHFNSTIDLHIHALLDDPSSIDKRLILSTQLDYFQHFMQQAIRLGVERVFIIHGLGEGKLRAAVHDRLAAMPDVLDYKNEYHPLYGWGATEVFL